MIRIPSLLPLVALALAGCSQTPTDPRSGQPLVRTSLAGGAAQSTRAFSGVVSARVQSDLGFRVGGKIVERLVDAGQLVRRGQALMRIDRQDLALATAAQTGAVEAARARAIQTAADERRYRDLVSSGAISALAYDQAKAAADAAQAQLRAAQAQAGVTRNGVGYSVLVADADGVVVETLGEPGQVVAAGQTVLRLAHAGPREAVVHLPETLRPVVGSLAQAVPFASGRTYPARLRQLSNAADPATRTYEARYVLDGAAAQAPLGSTITVELGQAQGVSATQVPLSAIFDGGKGAGVWVVSGQNVRWRPVRIASLGQETATISAGLAKGERYVTLGAHLLHDGQAVRVEAGQ